MTEPVWGSLQKSSPLLMACVGKNWEPNTKVILIKINFFLNRYSPKDDGVIVCDAAFEICTQQWSEACRWRNQSNRFQFAS